MIRRQNGQKGFDAHVWKDSGAYHCLLFTGPLPGHMSIEFRAPSWRGLRRLLRDHGYDLTTLREKDVKEQWRMPKGHTWVATG